MDRQAQKKLVDELLSHNGDCNVDINIWRPSIQQIKYILALGYDRIEANGDRPTCTIFIVYSEKIPGSTACAVRCALFCNEPEAKFMRKYVKREGVKNSENKVTSRN